MGARIYVTVLLIWGCDTSRPSPRLATQISKSSYTCDTWKSQFSRLAFPQKIPNPQLNLKPFNVEGQKYVQALVSDSGVWSPYGMLAWQNTSAYILEKTISGATEYWVVVVDKDCNLLDKARIGFLAVSKDRQHVLEAQAASDGCFYLQEEVVQTVFVRDDSFYVERKKHTDRICWDFGAERFASPGTIAF
ncbi:MAG: hypothetical protein ACUVRD_00725 [Bacteroidia bacterium]